MRHLLVLFVLFAAAYGLWLVGGRQTLHKLVRHALRLGAVLALLFGLLVLAYYFNAPRLL